MRLTTSGGAGAGLVPSSPDGAHAAAGVAVVVMLVIVFLLDRATGSAPVQHLYYMPIVLAAVRFGIRGGVIAPAVAILLYHAADPRLVAFGYGHWDIVQISLFVAVGLITAKLTDDRRRLQVLAATDDLTGLHNLRSF